MLKDLSFINPKSNGSVVIDFDPNKRPLTGQQMLTQMIIKRIFTLRGSNSYDPEVGTNFTKAFGTVDLDEVDAVENTFPVMINNLQDQIREQQLDYELEGGRIPPEQKLISLTLNKAEFDEIFGGWIIEIVVDTENNQFTVNIP